MEVITKVLDELIDIPPNHFVFDIETTGLNSNYCKVILIGILFNQDNKTVIKQYFANTEDDEKELLLSFINDIKNYKNHIIKTKIKTTTEKEDIKKHLEHKKHNNQPTTNQFQ